MRISDQKLRSDRLVFYAQDVSRLDGELDGFLEFSGARCAALIDREGHLVTRRGEAASASMESFSALVAGTFAATRQVAQLLGEDTFTTMSHQGGRQCIQVALVGDRSLLAIVWDERTNLGLIRFYANETIKRLERVFLDIAARPPAQDEGLAAGYSKEASAALDELF